MISQVLNIALVDQRMCDFNMYWYLIACVCRNFVANVLSESTAMSWIKTKMDVFMIDMLMFQGPHKPSQFNVLIYVNT